MPTDTPAGTRSATAPSWLGERLAGGAQLGVEHRHLDRRLGHRVALEPASSRGDVVGGDVADARTAAARRSAR